MAVNRGALQSTPRVIAVCARIYLFPQIASDQIKLDKRINSLMQTLVSVFDFVADASRLADMADAIASLRRTIIKLLDQLIECSLFIRRYARRTFTRKLIGATFVCVGN